MAHPIVHGRGVSDLFGEVTGIIAWVPPLISLLLAGLLLVSGRNSLAAPVVVILAPRRTSRGSDPPSTCPWSSL